MIAFDGQITALLSWDVFRQLAHNQPISLFQFNHVMQMLVEHNIPFDISFVSGNRKSAAALQLTVHINPTTTMVFVVALEPGASVFTPSP